MAKKVEYVDTSIFTKELLKDEYIKNKKSAQQIAKEYGSYPMAVLRLLTKYGIPKKDSSEVQKDLHRGGHVVPHMKGKKHKPETLLKLSKSLTESYANLTEEQKKEFSERSKKNWKKQSKEWKEEIYNKSKEALRKTLKEGSYAEKLLRDALREAGFDVEFLRTDILSNKNLEVDILLNNERIAIEVDGPAHYAPIYGEESYQRYKKADRQKDQLVLGQGYHMIRVKLTGRKLSTYRGRMLQQALLEKVREIRSLKVPALHFVEEEV